jgi:hypothetical protein
MRQHWTNPEDDERAPEPLEQGNLEPPRRKPPTAIGTATPRGPRRPYRPGRYHRLGMSRTRRIALGLLSGLLTTSGAAIGATAWPSMGMAVTFGVGMLSAGIFIGYHAAVRGTELARLGDYLMRQSKQSRSEARTRRDAHRPAA